MGFLRRTFSRRSRFQTRERDELDDKGGVGVTGNPLLLPHQQQVVHAPAVVSGGATVHIPAAGTARSTITCRVLLLDGTDVSVDLPVNRARQEVRHKVMRTRCRGWCRMYEQVLKRIQCELPQGTVWDE
ncbi:hypothetical protein XENOCAPTIV_002409 [Xenoophorus captivus]|uniref:Uncharacterized protein n=1 Tax=Xenoophorus captivus TaxID=1517983 RepID=A0ABV0SEL2_9TELE